MRDDSETPQSHQDDTKTSISGPHEKAKYEYKEESKTENKIKTYHKQVKLLKVSLALLQLYY